MCKDPYILYFSVTALIMNVRLGEMISKHSKVPTFTPDMIILPDHRDRADFQDVVSSNQK
jgi:hypothetical protein